MIAFTSLGMPAAARADTVAATPAVATITVSAEASVEARPDVAVVSVGVVREAPTTAAALAEANKAATALLGAVKGAGIPAADIATSEFSVTPVWAQKKRDGRDVSVIAGYSVTNRFTIRIRDLDKLGPVLETAIGEGGNSVSGLGFEVSDAEARRDEARAAAVKAALARADLLATAAGQKVVRVVSLTEGGAEPPRPVFARMKAMAADAVPVEAGTETLTATVGLTVEIAPATAH